MDIEKKPNQPVIDMNIEKLFEAAVQRYEAGDLEQAETIFRGMLEIRPDPDTYSYLGDIMDDFARTEEALTCYRKALELNPNFPRAHYNIAGILQRKGELDEALACYQKALNLDPACADIYNSIGAILQTRWQLDEALTCYQRALSLDPNFAIAHGNIGGVLLNLGRLNEAESHLRLSLRLKPDRVKPYSSLLMLMNYRSRSDNAAFLEEYLDFQKRFEEPLRSERIPCSHKKNSGRKLKIGYISGDFRKHAVAYFAESVLAVHDRKNFTLFCYSNSPFRDDVTERFQGYADKWRDISGTSDERAAGLIREDKIDILVDLAGHTAYNRLLVFARKPAPVQVSWIGYPATTGLAAMDYKIVDEYTDPPGTTERFYTEELMRMPESFLCYLPDRDSPGIGNVPALTAGYVTFGSFNAFVKISPEVIELWTKILKMLPGSRLVMKAKSFSGKSTRDYAMDLFVKRGNDASRIELLAGVSSIKEHLDIYKRIDIALDTVPYNGTTTTCEALWMGVPVVTLAGDRHASRVGTSLLTNIGLPELVAQTEDEYRKIAVQLAADLGKLRFLREHLRDMMRHSPLTNAERFTANLENCYRKMWRTYCAEKGAGHNSL
jgi:protein O-GlcNAc transferase